MSERELEGGGKTDQATLASASQAAAAATVVVAQESSRSDSVTVEFGFDCPLALLTVGIRTTNVRIEKAGEARLGPHVRVKAIVSSWSTTLHSRLHVSSTVGPSGECVLELEVDGSVWDLGMTSAEITVTLPVHEYAAGEHPGIRVDIPNGAIGVTMLGDTSIRFLDLKTGHGPAHLSDVAVGSLLLVAHHGNITVHDICATGVVDITGHGAWIDVDDVRAAQLTATSSDAIISLKDIDAKTVSATTSNARIGLGNIRADTLKANTTNGEIAASNVTAAVCSAMTTKGSIEGDWCPTAKLHLATAEAKIAARVLLDSAEHVEMLFVTKRAPIQVDLPASFSGGFSLETTGYYKTFVYTHPKVKANPVLHVAKPDKKVGVLDSTGIHHSLKATSEEAPVTVNFGTL
ncbi:hypothetical protein LPJ61_004584 [Coemansia biformis]|uniref:DUF4097 domain-containing protein n=1 Tax=Coemansia biformis TaxID=1286918 RepID=A0A9W7Y4K3_9FUNG|nr:hypothetical protein LPJ61_004584 [Coemansia biformis]